MKRRILLSWIFTLSLVLVSSVSAAGYGLPEAAGRAKYDVAPSNNIYNMVQGAITVVLGLIAFVFFGLITMSGIRWLTARGNEEFVTRAKDTLGSAVWGLLITMGAYAITTFVFNALNQ